MSSLVMVSMRFLPLNLGTEWESAGQRMLERTQCDWLDKVLSSSPVERRHNLMEQSAEPDTSKSVELSDKASDSTGAV